MDDVCRTRLTSPPQASLSASPAVVSQSSIYPSLGFRDGQKKESGTWFTTLVFFRKETIDLATGKHDSVLNVLCRQYSKKRKERQKRRYFWNLSPSHRTATRKAIASLRLKNEGFTGGSDKITSPTVTLFFHIW